MQTDAQRAAKRRYYERHLDEIRTQNRLRIAARRAADPEIVRADRENAKRWAAANPERRQENQKRWREGNPHYQGKWHLARKQTDEHFRIRVVLTNAIHNAITRRASGRDWRADAKIGVILGCSKPDLIAHIEAQFLPGMSWSNYGRRGWEIDHIKQCASFDLTQHDQVLLCFHYTNLRPLWRPDNQRRPRKE